MQVVILAGGLATRLGSLSQKTPKSMIRVHGKLFLEHQVELLSHHGLRDLLLCVGHLSEEIYDYFGDGSRHGVSIRYSYDGPTLVGTGGALKRAAQYLDDEFLVMYGDSYLLLDYEAIIEHFTHCTELGMMVIYKNENKHERSNVAVQNGFVTVYDSNKHFDSLLYIDEGLTVLHRKSLDLLPDTRPVSLGVLFERLVEKRQLRTYETQQRFYEIGSLNGLRELEAFLRETDIPERPEYLTRKRQK